MSSILIANLTRGTVERESADSRDYGRGLAVRLLREHTPPRCGRLSPDNAFVIAPGLLAGTPVPCATRATVAARGDGGLAVTNITGDMPQKLASLDIAAVVLKGKARAGNAVLRIDGGGARILHMPELEGLDCGALVERLRGLWGAECAIAGCGPAADLGIPLSGLFTTYPEGTPRYTCPRSSFGDVPGSKGLRAVVVRCGRYFDAPCADRAGLQAAGKRLARRILDDPICGGALPGLGSITLLHLLKNRGELPPLPEKRAVRPRTDGERVNYCCAPMCVIGCLNRHSAGSGRIYAAPEEAEVRAAVGACFGGRLSGAEMDACAAAVSARGLALGLNATEFVYAASMYLDAAGQEPAPERLEELLEEVAAGTVTGRILGGGTAEIARLYRDREALQARMTRPAVQQEQKYALQMRRICPELAQIDDLELLYREIFLLENLGLCIFSSFALLDEREPVELLARLASCKTGRAETPESLLDYAGRCLREEESLQRQARLAGESRSIPVFVKGRYRYFEKQEAGLDA